MRLRGLMVMFTLCRWDAADTMSLPYYEIGDLKVVEAEAEGCNGRSWMEWDLDRRRRCQIAFFILYTPTCITLTRCMLALTVNSNTSNESIRPRPSSAQRRMFVLGTPGPVGELKLTELSRRSGRVNGSHYPWI